MNDRLIEAEQKCLVFLRICCNKKRLLTVVTLTKLRQMLVLCAGVSVSHTPLTLKPHRFLPNSVNLPHYNNNYHIPSCFLQTLNANPTSDSDDALRLTVPSAVALAAAIRKASTSPVEFTQRFEKDRQSGLVLPSTDFHRLCLHQLHLFRRIVPEALLSVAAPPFSFFSKLSASLLGFNYYKNTL